MSRPQRQQRDLQRQCMVDLTNVPDGKFKEPLPGSFKEVTMTRYVLEGTWTGYVSRQCRNVHREIVSEKRANKLRHMHKIIYTDGTALLLHIREAAYREKVQEIFSYRDLIRQAEAKGGTVVLVSELAA